ncbi:DNA primase family protein [Amycolatopsis sp. NBC_00438]|uniref:DNA primase family protein n=1 Tax=Amycolatopsis sp. NBC_00438 TaxID=2903558 RepID=UPI002E1DF2C4
MTDNVVRLVQPSPAAMPSGGLQPHQLQETVFVERVADALRGRFLYTDAMGWLEWTGQVWVGCSNVPVRDAVRLFIREFSRAAAVDDGKSLDFGELLKRIATLNSAAKVNALTDLARGLLLADAADFDVDPDVLNCRNGLLNLETLELTPHDPSMMVTKCTDVDYVPGATSPAWDAALAALGPDANFRAWYQLRKGQAITGHVADDDVLTFEWGAGSNGKSTLVGAINAALGDYFTMVPDKLLLGSPGDHSTEWMALRGVRYAQVEELPEARTMDVAKLRKLVGTHRITARQVYKDNESFPATHTLFVNTNFMPVVAETDNGTWRRLCRIAFTARYRTPGDESRLGPFQPGDVRADTTVRDRLKRGEGAEAVLAWLVTGAHAWYSIFKRQMPPMPAAVVASTDTWRLEQDEVLQIFTELVEAVPPGSTPETPYVTAKDLVAALRAWRSDRGYQGVWNERLVATRFETHPAVTSNGVCAKRLREGQPGYARSVLPGSLGVTGWASSGPNGPTSSARSMAWLGLRFRA